MASSRGTRKPVTRIAAEKHAFVARTTVTCAPGIGVVSAARSLLTGSTAKMAGTDRIAPVDAIANTPENLISDARYG
jgi:hypothetical protein